MNCTQYLDINGTKLYFVLDANGQPIEVSYKPANSTSTSYYFYVHNAMGDVMAILDTSGNAVVEYRYDAWGNIISTTGSMASTLGVQNPFRYRSYVYDQETGLYYLQSRYYNPTVGRFINSDIFVSTGQGILGNNTYAYCGNNPVNRADTSGCFWDVVFDVVSLVSSIVDVIQDPTDVGAWVGLALDVVDLAVPLVGGLGEVADTVNAARKFSNAADSTRDAGKIVDVGSFATKGTPQEVGKIGERLAGIDPRAKVKININGRNRIPDALTKDSLIEVKNVKSLSNTLQLRDYADYAKATGRKLVLYVRPTTDIAQTVIDAGWEIRSLW